MPINAVQDQFQSVFGAMPAPAKEYDRDVERLKRIADGLKAMRPDMEALAGTQAAGLSKIRQRQYERCATHDFIESASLHECKSVLDSMIDRVVTLTGSASELEDAASAIADALEYEACPANCPCDSCAAARSDEAYDRKINAEAADSLRAYTEARDEA